MNHGVSMTVHVFLARRDVRLKAMKGILADAGAAFVSQVVLGQGHLA